MLKKCVCCLCIALFCTVSLQAQDTSRQTVSETQAEIRYYAPKLKFESRGLPSYNFRDTLHIILTKQRDGFIDSSGPVQH